MTSGHLMSLASVYVEPLYCTVTGSLSFPEAMPIGYGWASVDTAAYPAKVNGLIL